jgi:hypothetical protein
MKRMACNKSRWKAANQSKYSRTRIIIVIIITRRTRRSRRGCRIPERFGIAQWIR